MTIYCAKAILLAIAEVEKDTDIRSLRWKDYDLLKRRAIAIHQKIGVSQGPCGFEEIAFFEQTLKYKLLFPRWLQISSINARNAAKLSCERSALKANIDVGCFHHGCEMYYNGDLFHPLAGTTMRSQREKTEGAIDMLRQRGYNVIQMFEHDFVNLKKTEKFQEFLLQHEVTDRLNPRDAFFVTRTNGVNLFSELYID
ncbi:DNA_pol_B_2 domain-containing protein, partial [Nephila pilipes]